MSQPDDNPVTPESKGEHDGKTIIMMRCPKHGTVYLPSESCPECAKERAADTP